MATTRTPKPVVRKPRDDRDGAWKEILGRRFPQAMAFFHPQAYAEIDWSRGVEFLQQELREAARVAAKGRRVVDVLARVWLKDGQDAWVLLHVEVQSHPDASFDQRMFIYNTVLFARHKGPIVSMGVVGHPHADEITGHFDYEKWGCRASLDYPVVRLFDCERRWEELEQSGDPFALVILAHIASYRTVRKPESRLRMKVRLMRQLQRQGRLSQEEIEDLFRFVDLVMPLPDDLADEYDVEVKKVEDEQQMPRIGQFEQRAEARGEARGALQALREAVLEALQLRFPGQFAAASERLQGISDPGTLRELHRKAITASSPTEFEGALQ